MAVWSVIQKSQLEGAIRLDSEYYQPEYLTLMDSLKKNPTVQLNSIAFVTDGIHASIDYDNKSNIRCLSAQYLQDNYFDLSANTFISENQHKMNLRTSLKAGDVILSSVGTIGNCAVVTEDILPANADRHVAIIRLSEGEFSPFYLSVFFNSKYGKFQTIREATGNVQLNLFIDKIKTLKIPVLKKHEEIHELSKKSCDMIYLANSLYSQAENLLLEELGLKDFKPQEDLSYVVNLSDVKSAHRADAEYFQPKYATIIETIKKYKAKLLPDVIDNVPARFNPLSQPDKTFKYVELSNINSSIGIIDGYSEVIGSEAPSRAKRVLMANDVIVSSIEGSLEKVALVNAAQDEFLASTGFSQFRSKEILPEVLLVLAKSPVLQMQLEKQCAGTILTAVSKEAIKNIVVPILPNPIQQKIADLVRRSHEARNKAKELLEEAKRKVDEAIENN